MSNMSDAAGCATYVAPMSFFCVSEHTCSEAGANFVCDSVISVTSYRAEERMIVALCSIWIIVVLLYFSFYFCFGA